MYLPTLFSFSIALQPNIEVRRIVSDGNLLKEAKSRRKEQHMYVEYITSHYSYSATHFVTLSSAAAWVAG